MRTSRWHYVRRDMERRIVWIADDNDGGMSVTNDAEQVVKAVERMFPCCRIIYRDTDGNWDELKHDGDRFTGFAAARDMVPT